MDDHLFVVHIEGNSDMIPAATASTRSVRCGGVRRLSPDELCVGPGWLRRAAAAQFNVCYAQTGKRAFMYADRSRRFHGRLASQEVSGSSIFTFMYTLAD